MNRKQEIAAWLFGLLIALGLLVTDNGIWALFVLAGLTILSLRDRHKKKQKVTEALPRSPSQPVAPTIPPVPEADLRNVTPHLLAVAMLQIVRERSNMWRDPEIEIPQQADAAVAIACETYELRIFLDLLKQRFGSGISKLVEASFASIVDDVDGLSMFSRVSAAILRARRLGPAAEGPEDPNLRLDLQVANQILSLFGESDEERRAVRLPLAQSLSRGRISAQFFFPALVAKTDFDPLSVALVTRETEYKGTTRRWSEVPGCFERHLQRKEGNLLFPDSERQPTQEEIREACAKDKADLERLQKDIAAFFQKAERFRDQPTVKAGALIDFLQYEVSPLMTRATEIGGPALREYGALEHILDSVFKNVGDSSPGGKSESEGLKEALQQTLDPLLAQVWRSDTPIKGEEITSTLLCESVDTITSALEVLEEKTTGTAHALYEGSVRLLEDAAKEGFVLPGGDEKLALLKAFAGGAKSPAAAPL